ncbi:VOC family protein [Gordonia sp. TBRC 11910]|uniref:VOC family protein n=1 Tax=Gordonia asplenii TaxID=2725283 RepID=A0A848L7H6_9ACTN|nr:VOC family protein [Gordonia asplenii]NMO03528.1 VOC family protein [Gordonia asplenii]
MGIQRVGHVVVKMRDLEEAKRFYGGILGMTISSESPIAIFFRFGDYHHDIGVFKVDENAESPSEGSVGLLHFALVVDSEAALLETYEHLKAQGVTIEATFDHGMTHSLYVYDPDGNAIEIYCEVPEYDWRANDDFVGHLLPLDLEAAVGA